MTKLDETTKLSPNYNQDGLIAAIAQDIQTKEVLMMAWMNQDALNKSIETGQAHYWSRSRQKLWHKGETSGDTQIIHDILIDCDQDCILLLVKQNGDGACHTKRPTCFYRSIEEKDGQRILHFHEKI